MDIKKSECVSVIKAYEDIKVTRKTLYAYLDALGIKRLKFPFDSKLYISRSDFERVKTFIAENKGE